MLLRVLKHPSEGYELLDSFGESVTDGDLAAGRAQSIANQLLKRQYPVEKIGLMVDYIEKPSGVVRLETVVFKVTIDIDTDVVMQDGYVWYDQQALASDERFSRDAHLIPYYFGDSFFSIEFAESQMGQWKDAILLWTKNIQK